MSTVKANVIRIVKGLPPLEPERLVALADDQVVATVPAEMSHEELRAYLAGYTRPEQETGGYFGLGPEFVREIERQIALGFSITDPTHPEYLLGPEPAAPHQWEPDFSNGEPVTDDLTCGVCGDHKSMPKPFLQFRMHPDKFGVALAVMGTNISNIGYCTTRIVL